jgi:hypothetical protein
LAAEIQFFRESFSKLETVKHSVLLLALVAACAHDLARHPANTSEAVTLSNLEDFDEGLRFGSEWTFSSDELLASFPSNGNEVIVETSESRAKVEALKVRLAARNPQRGPERFRFTETDHHSHWTRRAYTVT